MYDTAKAPFLRVILSEERISAKLSQVETRRANGNAVWISQKSELNLENNSILNLITVRSDRIAVALRVSTSDSASLRPSLKMTHGGDTSRYRTGGKNLICKQTHKLPFTEPFLMP